MHEPSILTVDSSNAQNNVTVVGSPSVIVNKEKGRLDFYPVLKSDEGLYTCRAHNDVGDARDDGFLKVLGEKEPVTYLAGVLH